MKAMAMTKIKDAGHILLAEFEAYSTISDRHRYNCRLSCQDGDYKIVVGSRSVSSIWQVQLESKTQSDALHEYFIYLHRGMDTAWIPLTDKIRIGNRFWSSLDDVKLAP